jgi:cytoskeletal protein RodZ
MPTLGHTLATERLRQNIDLEFVAAVTRISPRMLKAIEMDDFDQLPGRVFARNFVRQYAQVLKLNADAVLAQFEREQSPGEMPETVKSKEYSAGFSLNLPALADVFGNNTLGSFLTFVVTIGACAIGVWAFNNWGTVRAHVLPTSPSTNAPQSARTNIPAAGSRPPATKPSAAVEPAKPPLKAAGELDSPAIPSSGAAVHVLLAASDSCWTRITADGKVLFAGTLNAGESRQVNAASVVDVRAGNAGALTLKLNGSAVPALGPKGQTRTVILTPDGAHVRTPTPEPVSEPL